MITPQLAQQLMEAGLEWEPKLHDFFWIPERGFDERFFVISDLQAHLELYQGWPVVTFHGSAEWALDYMFQQDVVWIPTEEQLRRRLAGMVSRLVLTYSAGEYYCLLDLAGQEHTFTAAKGSDAYGEALLFVLLSRELPDSGN